MNNAYTDYQGNKTFTKSYCAYFDILGFSEKIKKSDLAFFNKYLKVLNKELKYLDKLYDRKSKKSKRIFELKIFTDNFVVGCPWRDNSGESELGDIFEILSHIQLTFLYSDIFIRGAISVSDLYMDENIVLGPALIESYELESKKAIYPRIILSKDVEKNVLEYIGYYGDKSKANQNREYLIDIDGVYFLNYLYCLLSGFISEDEIIRNIKRHKRVVIRNLKKNEHNYKLFEKFSWTAKYHNFFCVNFILPFLKLKIKHSDIKINDDLYDKNITRIPLKI